MYAKKFYIILLLVLFVLPIVQATEVNTTAVNFELTGSEATYYTNTYNLPRAVASASLSDSNHYISALSLSFAFVANSTSCSETSPNEGFSTFFNNLYTIDDEPVNSKSISLETENMGAEITAERNSHFYPSELTHNEPNNLNSDGRDFYCLILKADIRLELGSDFQRSSELAVMKVWLEPGIGIAINWDNFTDYEKPQMWITIVVLVGIVFLTKRWMKNRK